MYVQKGIWRPCIVCVPHDYNIFSFFLHIIPSSSHSQLNLSISIICFLATLTFVPYFRFRSVPAHPWKPISSLSAPQQCKTPTQSSSSVLIRPGINRKRTPKRLPFIRQHERMDFPKKKSNSKVTYSIICIMATYEMISWYIRTIRESICVIMKPNTPSVMWFGTISCHKNSYDHEWENARDSKSCGCVTGRY